MLFDFKCDKCGLVTEYNIPMKDRGKVIPCGVCVGNKRAVLSAVRSIFKGKGFPGNDTKPHNEGT